MTREQLSPFDRARAYVARMPSAISGPRGRRFAAALEFWHEQLRDAA
jgi:hypothetical protein